MPSSSERFDTTLTLLGCEFDLSVPDRWHRSPDTGKSWPLVYAQAIDATGPQAAGDVKFVWELNRHQFLPAMVEQDPRLVGKMIRDWVAQNPFEFGINWHSALEAGLRLIAWLETFEKAPQLRAEFSRPLAQHAAFIRHNLGSDWIPRGNHLIGEAAALAVYGQPSPWLRQAAVEQFHPSGVHREQATAYHKFVTHLFSIAELPQPKALAYLAAIQQPDGSLPQVGDSDEGIATLRPIEISPAPVNSAIFADAGQYVIREGGDYCFVRSGEFGLPPNFSHAHADLLSPILWLGGVPIFVDSGTFTYNGDAQWRRHFRSAQAHNVVTVDDRDYAEQSGTFAWNDPPRGVCESWSDHEFAGTHDAYRRIGVTIRRRIRHTKGAFTIHDEVQGSGRHRLLWQFHLHPNLRITRCTEDSFELGGRFGLRVLNAEGMRLQVGKGWHSTSYNQRVPVDVCEISLDAALPVTAEFALQ